MITSKPVKVGLDAMLTPDNCALMLIDHQPFQASGVKNIDAALMINNVVMLAKAAKAFNVPTLLTAVLKDRGGNLIKPLQDVFPEQTPIDRKTINTWEDESCLRRVHGGASTGLGSRGNSRQGGRDHARAWRRQRHQPGLGTPASRRTARLW